MHQPTHTVYYQVVSIGFEEVQEQSACIVTLASQTGSGEVRVLLDDLMQGATWKEHVAAEDYVRLQRLHAVWSAH